MLLLAGCSSSPPRDLPEPRVSTTAPADPNAERPWDGRGGVAEPRSRGAQLADLALSLRGLPYRYGGATREGFDCSGLVFFTHRQLGLPVPRTSRDQADDAREVKPARLEPGDLVFFKIDSRKVNHVGIYVGERRFVHAPRSGRPVTDNSLDEEYYARRFFSAGRFWDRSP